MSELLREQMSAFVDDALPAGQSELLLRRLGEDRALVEAYACYQLIGASLRREPDASGLADRVHNALRDEAAVPTTHAPAWRRVLRPALGAAVAAAVAVLAIGVLRGLPGEHAAPSAQVAGAPNVTPVVGSEPESYTVAPRTASMDTGGGLAGKAQLVQYALRHGNYATMPNPVIMNYRSVVGVGQRTAAEDELDEAPPTGETPEPQRR